MPSTPHILDAAQLPLIHPFISRLGLEKLIDAACPIAAHANLTHGQVVLAIVANRLCNPQAMSGILDWARESGLGDIFGFDVAYLNDDRLARCLDAVASQLDSLQGSVLLRMLEQFQLDLGQLHWDLTSVVFRGDAPDVLDPEDYALPAYGYGGEPDCKQVRVGELLSADGGVPLMQLVQDGNLSDQGTIMGVLERMADHVNLRNCLVIGDGKLLSDDMAGQMRRQSLRFLTSTPRHAGTRALYASLDPNSWEHQDYLPARQAGRKPEARTVYEVQEAPWCWTCPESGEVEAWRYLIVRNHTERETRATRRLSAVKKLVEGLNGLLGRCGGHGLKTREQLERKLERLLQDHPRATAFVKVQIRSGKNVPDLQWSLDEQAIQAAGAMDGVTVLRTNISAEEADGPALLRQWKNQMISERRFSDWKGVVKVRPIFLQTPRRIAALLWLMHVALAVACLIEREVRENLAARGREKLAGLRNGTQAAIPTFELIFKAFRSLHLLKWTEHGTTETRLTNFTPLQQSIWSILDLGHPP